MKMKNPDTKRAVAKLREAIALHEKHMNGSAPTSVKSQTAMMQMMREALSALQPNGGLLDLMGMG